LTPSSVEKKENGRRDLEIYESNGVSRLTPSSLRRNKVREGALWAVMTARKEKRERME
jgi:hypothetical protein